MTKKINWLVIVTGLVVGIAAIVLTAFGNPANMGFCIACFLRDIAGATHLHGAEVVQYVRPEIVGLVLGATIMALATGEFKARAGSSPATRFVLGMFVFFFDVLSGMATESGKNMIAFIILGLCGINFVIELVVNMALSSVITHVVHIRNHSRRIA